MRTDSLSPAVPRLLLTVSFLAGGLLGIQGTPAAEPEKPNIILFLADDLKEGEPERLAAMREQLVRHKAAVDADGPDWWQRLSPSGGNAPKAKAEDRPRKKAKQQSRNAVAVPSGGSVARQDSCSLRYAAYPQDKWEITHVQRIWIRA